MVRKPAQVTVRAGSQTARTRGDHSHRWALAATVVVASLGGWLLWSVLAVLEPRDAPASQTVLNSSAEANAPDFSPPPASSPQAAQSTLANRPSGPSADASGDASAESSGDFEAIPHNSLLLSGRPLALGGICSIPDESRPILEWVWANGGAVRVATEGGLVVYVADPTRWRSTQPLLSPDQVSEGAITIDAMRLPYPLLDGELARCLGAASQISHLAVAAELLTDQGLAQLRHCAALTDLEITRATFSPDGVRYVSEAPALRSLSLTGSTLPSDALRPLGGCVQLVYLSLEGADFEFADLDYLAALPHLSRLDLRRTEVGDHSLDALSRLTPLRQLDVASTSISAPGLQRLREALPLCKVWPEDPPEPNPHGWSDVVYAAPQ